MYLHCQVGMMMQFLVHLMLFFKKAHWLKIYDKGLFLLNCIQVMVANHFVKKLCNSSKNFAAHGSVILIPTANPSVARALSLLRQLF